MDTDNVKIHLIKADQQPRDLVRQLINNGQQENAFYVLDIDDILRKYDHWKEFFPRMTPFYAMKSNDHPSVLKTLAALGTSFDCASKSEISRILDLGVAPDRIIFAMATKPACEIGYAASVGVLKLTFDNEGELYKIKKDHPEASVILRIRCDTKQNAESKLGQKFGAGPKSGARLMQLARQLGLNLVGISFHVGSDCNDPEAFGRAIRIGREMFDLARDIGFSLNLLDLGGGYNGKTGTDLRHVAGIINSGLDEHFPVGCGVDIIAEPGRFFVQSAGILATKIIGVRQINEEDEIDDDVSHFYYINDGIHGSFLFPRLDYLKFGRTTVSPELLDEEKKKRPEVSCNVYGSTCDGFDIVALNILLPLAEAGQWLVFTDMGAYSRVLGSSFNGIATPRTLPVARQEAWQRLRTLVPFNDACFETNAFPSTV